MVSRYLPAFFPAENVCTLCIYIYVFACRFFKQFTGGFHIISKVMFTERYCYTLFKSISLRMLYLCAASCFRNTLCALKFIFKIYTFVIHIDKRDVYPKTCSLFISLKELILCHINKMYLFMEKSMVSTIFFSIQQLVYLKVSEKQDKKQSRYIHDPAENIFKIRARQ